MKFLDEIGFSYFINKLKNMFDKKVDKVEGKMLSTESYETAEKNKLAGVQSGANKYVHPSSHPANIITENSTKRFVSDVEKTKWSNKWDYSAPAIASVKSTLSGKADVLGVADTRNTNPNPSTFPARTFQADFKSRAAINNPPISTASSYSHIVTMNGWTGAGAGGGGETTQLAFGDSLAVRVSDGASTWKSWNRLVNTDDLQESRIIKDENTEKEYEFTIIDGVPYMKSV